MRDRDPVPEARRVEWRDAVRAVREVEPGAEEVVAVACDLRQDLAEAERDDREVVAAQAQCREADEDPEERCDRPRYDQDHPERDVETAGSRQNVDRPQRELVLRDEAVVQSLTLTPLVGHFWPANCADANHAAVYAPMA